MSNANLSFSQRKVLCDNNTNINVVAVIIDHEKKRFGTGISIMSGVVYICGYLFIFETKNNFFRYTLGWSPFQWNPTRLFTINSEMGNFYRRTYIASEGLPIENLFNEKSIVQKSPPNDIKELANSSLILGTIDMACTVHMNEYNAYMDLVRS
jgi:hypothetical protein